MLTIPEYIIILSYIFTLQLLFYIANSINTRVNNIIVNYQLVFDV